MNVLILQRCVFFFCVCVHENLVHCGGDFLGSNLGKFLIVFKTTGKNQKKIKEKREFLRKTSFRPNRFSYMVVIQKLITRIFTKSVENAKICNRIVISYLRVENIIQGIGSNGSFEDKSLLLRGFI
ncbi:Uncharacterized protein FWK35_00018012, partial [Aphis craccivora]